MFTMQLSEFAREAFVITKELTLPLSMGISILAAVMYLVTREESRLYAMIAMFICSFGDIFMARIFPWGFTCTVVGALVFMVGHLFYSYSFVSRVGFKNLFNKGFKAGLITMGVFIVALAVLAFVIPEEPQIGMFFLLLIYVAVIGWHLCCNYAYASTQTNFLQKYVLPFGVLLFFISDYFIFLGLVDVQSFSNWEIWGTYAPAQILIVLLNAPFNCKKKSLKD